MAAGTSSSQEEPVTPQADREVDDETSHASASCLYLAHKKPQWTGLFLYLHWTDASSCKGTSHLDRSDAQFIYVPTLHCTDKNDAQTSDWWVKPSLVVCWCSFIHSLDSDLYLKILNFVIGMNPLTVKTPGRHIFISMWQIKIWFITGKTY